MATSRSTHPALVSWIALNEFLMGCSDEGTLQKLLKLERAAKARKRFVMRIHSRLNKVRADREREELT